MTCKKIFLGRTGRRIESKFKIIALSETWIHEGENADLNINGHDLFVSNRLNGSGGGVAMHVDSDLKCRSVGKLTSVLDDITESVAVEIELEKNRNIIFMCVYRKPGSNAENFTENLEDL